MAPFQTLTGVAAPLLRDNVDTDAIIPSREIRAVGRAGLADGLFAGWRYRTAPGRETEPDFVLNRAEYANARILLCGANFGCGSSREHAVWALWEFGIRAILASSFAPIFYDNCVSNGLLAGVMPEGELRSLAAWVAPAPQSRPLTIDLQRCQVRLAEQAPLTFFVDPETRATLLGGLDPIERTLQCLAQIEAHETRDRSARPWARVEAEP